MIRHRNDSDRKGDTDSAFFSVGDRILSECLDDGQERISNFDKLEKELATAGWTFFYMAGEIKTIAFGFDRQRRTDTALRRLMASVSCRNAIAWKLTKSRCHSFLGMPYVSVSAHSRHIQKGSVVRPMTYERAKD